jgi:hypothetical protein
VNIQNVKIIKCVTMTTGRKLFKMDTDIDDVEERDHLLTDDNIGIFLSTLKC